MEEKAINTGNLAVAINRILGLISGKCSKSHDHDGVYAPVNHNHDGAYAADDHSHEGVYAPADHNHEGVYAPADHNHEGVYAPNNDAIERADNAAGLEKTSYTANVKGKLFLVMVGSDDGMYPVSTVCVDWNMIPKDEQLALAVPGRDSYLYAIRDNAGVPTFSTGDGIWILDVVSYV